MKLTFLTLALILGFQINAQTVEKEIKNIDTPQQAENYIDGKRRKTHKLMVFNELNHNTPLARKLLKKSVGATEVKESEFEKTYLKIVEKTHEPHFRLRYIFLDGNKMSAQNISKTQQLILDLHKSGKESFITLAKKYSMAVNKYQGGDTSWVKINDLPAPLANESDINSHEIDELYIVNDPSNKLYYVVTKTHDSKRLKEVRVLRVVEEK